MYNEMNPEIFGDQGIYYTTPTDYAYYCTGFETPVEWEDHNRIFALDGSEIQFAGAQNENPPYVYYTPAYGYAQSPYNPYNPYIPGAVIGVDGSYVAPQQYYSVSPYQDAVSSPGYVPVMFQPDISANGLAEPLLDNAVAFASRHDGRSSKHGVATSSASFMRNSSKYNSAKLSEGARATVGSSKQPAANASFSSGALASSHALQSRNASASGQSSDKFSNGKFLPHHNQLKVARPANNGFSDFGSTVYGHTTVDKLMSKLQSGRSPNDVHGSSDVFDEQNRGPRTNKLKNQLTVKAYTTKVGNSDADGNIIIYTDQYNKDDFPMEYDNVKFFVIKSYSEDDVHKSIKYGVWSSTSHGNKKLQVAYEDAQKIAAGKAGGCPIFLFFSVNASGQFCGVAEMIGSVDFHKDMDFWQQDKWSGSFPVKWHFIKDVTNTSFRHIILENNENKPVTNSRDTQEIMFKQGLEMLRIFKSHNLKTTLLDDFMYYENRQKIMHDEKARYQSYETPFLVATHKLNQVIEQVPNRGEVAMEQNDPSFLKENDTSSSEQILNKNTKDDHTADTIIKVEDNSVATLNLGSLSLNTKQAESPSLLNAVSSGVSTESAGVVTVGSVPVKVNGFGESSSCFLTIMFKQGLEMLRIFKSHNLKTTLLDDFMYYENRQKIMHDEKARYQSYETPFLVATHKLNQVIEQVPNRGEVAMEQNDPSFLKENDTSSSEQILNKNTKDDHTADTIIKVEDNSVATLNLGSLSLNTKQAESPSLLNAVSSGVSTESAGVVTVGSVPVKVNGFGESSSCFLTVGTIPLDPRVLQIEKGGSGGLVKRE